MSSSYPLSFVLLVTVAFLAILAIAILAIGMLSPSPSTESDFLREEVRIIPWGAGAGTGAGAGIPLQEGLTSWEEYDPENKLVLFPYASKDMLRELRPLQGSSLFVDLKGMNIIEYDDTAHLLAVTTRVAKRYAFYTVDNKTNAISDVFFEKGGPADQSGTGKPFVVNVNPTSTSNRYQILYVPFKSQNTGNDNTFVCVWNCAPKLRLNELVKVIFTEQMTPSSGDKKDQLVINAFELASTAFPPANHQIMHARDSGPTVNQFAVTSGYEFVSPNGGGLAHLYGNMGANKDYASLVVGWSVYEETKTAKNPHYYYFNDATDVTTPKYPTLQIITPFVYYNPINGDLLVADGYVYLKSSPFNGTETAADIKRMEHAGTITSGGWYMLNANVDKTTMIKTSQLRRFLRPGSTGQPNDMLLDRNMSETPTTPNYDMFVMGTKDILRRKNRTINTSLNNDFSNVVTESLENVTGVKLMVCSSPLEQRVIYYVSFGMTTMIIVVSVDVDTKGIAFESVRVFDKMIEQTLAAQVTSTEVTATELAKYQNPKSKKPDATGKDDAATGDGKDDATTGDGKGGSSLADLAKLLGQQNALKSSLTDLERRAIFDAVATIFYSRNASSSSSGYTTHGCPSCFIEQQQVITPPEDPKKPEEEQKKTEDGAAAAADATVTTPEDNNKPKISDFTWAGIDKLPFPPGTTAGTANPNPGGTPAPAPAPGLASAAAATDTTATTATAGATATYPNDNIFRRMSNKDYKHPMPIAFDLSSFERR